jgi:hypothetical protein
MFFGILTREFEMILFFSMTIFPTNSFFPDRVGILSTYILGGFIFLLVIQAQ